MLSQMHIQLLESDRGVLKQVGLAQRIAALPELEPEPEPELGSERVEGSLFLASSLPPSLEAIANQQYQRAGSTQAIAPEAPPVLHYARNDQGEPPRSALLGYEDSTRQLSDLHRHD